MTGQAQALAYIDESGAKGGYLRNLTPERDHEIGVMAAIVIASGRVEELRHMLRPCYARLRSAVPSNEKLHFTDAFIHGEAVAAIARGVREEMFQCMERERIPIIYEACRLRACRLAYVRQEELVRLAQDMKKSAIKISYRASNERIEGRLMIGMALKLDAFMEEHGGGLLDLASDGMDRAIGEVLESAVEEVKQVSADEEVVKGWDPQAQKCIVGSISINVSASGSLNAKHLGRLCIVGKADPLVLLVDGVVNSLHEHLSGIGVGDPLNGPGSVRGWRLAGQTYGVRDDAFEDLL
jgi:hypothetical protein